MMKVLKAISKITRHTIFLPQLVFHLDLGIFYFQIDIKKKSIRKKKRHLSLLPENQQDHQV